MATLNSKLNDIQKWKELQEENQRRVEVDIHEVERVIDLARKTPGLAAYEENLRAMSVFFATETKAARSSGNWAYLNALVGWWDLYRESVMQRYSGVTPVELRTADKVVANIFDRFVRTIPGNQVSYSRIAKPLVYGGEGGPSAYFSIPRTLQRPFAIINLPHTAFDHVWRWLALPHETGHDLYASVRGLPAEVEDALETAMRSAVQNSEVQIPDVTVDLNPQGIPKIIQYIGEDFLATVWRGWANEAQADVIGYLNCGAAALVTLQQIIEFREQHPWLLFQGTTPGVIEDAPEEHPVPYIRNVLGIEVLRLIDGGSHNALADELQTRLDALAPQPTEIVFAISVFSQLGGANVIGQNGIEVARIQTSELIKSAKLAAKVLVQQNFAALGGNSYEQLGTFTAGDQRIVDALIDPIYGGEAGFVNEAQGVEPRHALAATVFAFERIFGLKDPVYREQRAAIINETFTHFV
ncbi:MAG: hypothetical protein J5I90_18020 [Caldilineales bacterium]|nr:hypothetical protein [Caldilineales bacterium]